MGRWPINRNWSLETENGGRDALTTTDLARYHACCLLGSAALGKTTELSYLSKLEQDSGKDVRYHRLALLATSADRLESRLEELASDTTSNSVLYLDALDEAMVPVRTAGIVLATWVRTRLRTSKPRIRLVCRTAVWPSELRSAIQEVYGDGMATALLQPLSPGEIGYVADSEGLESGKFLALLKDSGALTLAKQPLCLRMLIRLARSGAALPSRRRDLFNDSIILLASEPHERRELGTAIDIPPHELTDAAERLACLTLLSGRETVDFRDEPKPQSINWLELSSLPAGAGATLSERLVRAVSLSGLCEGDGNSRFRFSHRQISEYLAGRRLARLMPHQVKSLLASGLGWEHGTGAPLRETAAFAAMESEAVAIWLAQHDPEVIGLSDVADDALRRRGLLQLFERFRRHELTDAQATGDAIEFVGFKYPGMSADLRPILGERRDGDEDILACAIEVVESCELSDLSEDLVSIVLDAKAALRLRRAAGYALERVGNIESKRRLKPEIARLEAEDRDLAGLALRCNWPNGLTTLEVLDAIKPRSRDSHFGAMDSFLLALDRAGFDASDALAAGLDWARGFLRRGENFEPAVRIAKRIAHRATRALDQPGVLQRLSDLVIGAADGHLDSPVGPITSTTSGKIEEEVPPPFASIDQGNRREFIDALAAKDVDATTLWWAAREAPGLLTLEDVPWLLKRASDASLSERVRKSYAELVRVVPWYDDRLSVEAWLNVRHVHPISEVLSCALQIELDSDVARDARKQSAAVKRAKRGTRRRRLRPPPVERVSRVLELAETKDPRFFINLCGELTLDEFSTTYGFDRFLFRTVGWNAADDAVRRRLVGAAKGLLSAEVTDDDLGDAAPFSSILVGYMHAVWLILNQDPEWLKDRPAGWWERFSWHILRELHPNMHEEPEEPKRALLDMLYAHAPAVVRANIMRLATSTEQGSRSLLESLLRMIDPVRDAVLDEILCDLIRSGKCNPDRVGIVAEFVLTRDCEKAVTVCLEKLGPTGSEEVTVATQAAVALLFERSSESWEHLYAFLEKRVDLAKQVLSEFAHNRRLRHRREIDVSEFVALGVTRCAQLLRLLFQAYPPELDPPREGGFVSPDDSARELRGHVLNWIADQENGEAVVVLRQLEHEFGEKYPWLRRPRARAERTFRRTHWAPIPIRAIAELLAAESKRLIRSEFDALEGITEALRQYESGLRTESTSDLEDFWNVPTGGAPTPKAEERTSDKICAVVRAYFTKYAVTADREVQVFRRKVPRRLGGEPGSEVDVLLRVPPVGTADGDPIALPLEVKRSDNREAKTGLGEQLVDRYMRELGTNVGAFIVVWLDAPGIPPSSKPVWESLPKAIEYLTQQAKELEAESGGATRVGVIVVDASLRVAKGERGS